eukprot:scaffold3334_cov105-Pinguiococcus_pyrenoidosus.AAC.1
MPKLAFIGALVSLVLVSQPVSSFAPQARGRAAAQRSAVPADDAAFPVSGGRLRDAMLTLAQAPGFPIAEVAA